MTDIACILSTITGENKAQRHKKFVQSLKDFGIEYADLPLF